LIRFEDQEGRLICKGISNVKNNVIVLNIIPKKPQARGFRLVCISGSEN